ncbi:hypothetical protein M080_4914 [Bacteroides fragilis str. 3397 T10]|nr:hypothetical protein M080_4914 [Bacteroides fragilis str. 3397 T10]
MRKIFLPDTSESVFTASSLSGPTANPWSRKNNQPFYTGRTGGKIKKQS